MISSFVARTMSNNVASTFLKDDTIRLGISEAYMMNKAEFLLLNENYRPMYNEMIYWNVLPKILWAQYSCKGAVDVGKEAIASL